jgi:hypothetical protein
MNAQDEKGPIMPPNRQGDLESPFLDEELFTGEFEAYGGARLAALEAESPFLHAFAQVRAMSFDPEEPEEEIVEEEEWTETGDFLLDESEVFDDVLLADLEENIEEFEEGESYDEEFDDEDEEFLYAERKGVDFPDEDLLIDEEAASPEELLAEVEEEVSSDYLDGVTAVQEAPAFDETFFTELELEQETGAATLRDRIVEVAKREWENWGRGTLVETQPDAHKFLLKYWMEFSPNGLSQTKAEKWIKGSNPWSAVFISYVMREAGVGRAFAYATFHTTFIAAAKKAALAGDTSKFWAYPISAVRPEVGDLVCRDRSEKIGGPCANTNWANVAPGQISHSDIVVEVLPDHIVILGGNTGQKYPAQRKSRNTVGQRTIKLNTQGFVEPKQPNIKCKYFAIVKPPAVERPIPAPSSSAGSGDLLPTWLSEIVKSGRLTLQAAWAMLTGQRDVNTLTNMIFYARHPHLPVGYKIKPHEKQLAESWVRIRDEVVKPLLRRLAAGVDTGSSLRTVPAPSPTSTITPAQPSPGVIATVEQYRSLERILDRIRAAPKTYIKPRTRRVVVDGYERTDPRGDVWCQQAGLTLDEGALARMVASEVGTKPPQYMIAVIEATMNQARAKKISAFQQITMQGLKLKGGVIPKSAGYFGRQSGRWCASIQDPTLQHLEAVRAVLSAPESLVARDGRRWVDGKVMDSGHQAGKRLKNNAVTIVEKWGAEGWEWIGPVYGPDGQTLLLDPYRLMVFRLAGRGKADIRRGVEAMREGRLRWKINVD